MWRGGLGVVYFGVVCSVLWFLGGMVGFSCVVGTLFGCVVHCGMWCALVGSKLQGLQG